VTAARPLWSTVGTLATGGGQEARRDLSSDRQFPNGNRFTGDPSTGNEVPASRESPPRAVTAARRSGPTPSIADFYADLLQPLNERQRKGLISRLSVGYFEGWRPTRQEMAQLVAEELRRSHPRR
jgi:hypothetical protein